ncbi:hypothetical protein E4U42_002318 [Claviceps africana]|uniref:PHD-type domain-containing protein n=1 Tax=Claviceps africana TaxID=83212 RepID=A0A8K0J8E2_9HYPO|nr:hypothetical protein E4U42_002318 [Claviceps africana]
MDHTKQAAASVEDSVYPRFTQQVFRPTPAASSSRPPVSNVTSASSLKSLPAALPSAEPDESAAAATVLSSPANNKKKGTASTVKRVPKKFKATEAKKTRKKIKTGPVASGVDQVPSGDERSDSGPYCLCRGPDDHRWMICCERCEDWFHGECINMNKEIGEHLIEKFICPNCATEQVVTIYKKTCALSPCHKAARLAEGEPSVFCSMEHAQTWWERMVSRLPKAKGRKGLDDQLAQEEFMALLNSNLGATDAAGMWTLARTPFSDTHLNGADAAGSEGTLLFKILTDEENEFLDQTAQARSQLSEETVLCNKMFTLIEMAQERRRAAIDAGHFGDDICGYDSRLDVVSARDVFSAFAKSSEGEEIFRQSKLADPLGEDDVVRGMCDRKRCKAHSGWQKTLHLGIKHHIREMADEVAEMEEEEKIVRAAAGERWRRRQAENNWVEVLDG